MPSTPAALAAEAAPDGGFGAPALAPPAGPAAAGVDLGTDHDAARLLGVLGHDGRDPATAAEMYTQLRQIAHSHRIRWVGDPTMCTTALLHEAYLKLARSSLRFRSRAHFLTTSSRAMRQVLITYAEARCAQKRGGGVPDLPFDDHHGVNLSDSQAEEIAAIGEALRILAQTDERGARIVECRFFAGLTVDETAEALGLSPATITRCWREVRAKLYAALHPDA